MAAAEIDTSSTYVVDYSTEDVVKAWQTKRLQFIRVDELDENIKAALPNTQQDPVVLALASTAALQPMGKKQIDELCSAFANALLGVAIALLPEESASLEDKPGDGAEKPTIIGTMCIGWGGISPRNAHHRNAYMGITIARPYQNKGYGREAINWMLDWAFGQAGLHTVSLETASFNQRGVYLYKKLGFRVEGRRKETVFFNGGWHDEIHFGMTEDEWRALKSAR